MVLWNFRPSIFVSRRSSATFFLFCLPSPMADCSLQLCQFFQFFVGKFWFFHWRREKKSTVLRFWVWPFITRAICQQAFSVTQLFIKTYIFTHRFQIQYSSVSWESFFYYFSLKARLQQHFIQPLFSQRRMEADGFSFPRENHSRLPQQKQRSKKVHFCHSFYFFVLFQFSIHLTDYTIFQFQIFLYSCEQAAGRQELGMKWTRNWKIGDTSLNSDQLYAYLLCIFDWICSPILILTVSNISHIFRFFKANKPICFQFLIFNFYRLFWTHVSALEFPSIAKQCCWTKQKIQQTKNNFLIPSPRP